MRRPSFGIAALCALATVGPLVAGERELRVETPGIAGMEEARGEERLPVGADGGAGRVEEWVDYTQPGDDGWRFVGRLSHQRVSAPGASRGIARRDLHAKVWAVALEFSAGDRSLLRRTRVDTRHGPARMVAIDIEDLQCAGFWFGIGPKTGAGGFAAAVDGLFCARSGGFMFGPVGELVGAARLGAE